MLLFYPGAFALVIPAHWKILQNSTLTSFTSYQVSVNPSLETLFNNCKQTHAIPCPFIPLFFFTAFTTIYRLFLFLNGGIVE